MSGLNLRTGLGGGFGGGVGVSTAPPPASGSSVAQAAFGSGATRKPKGGLNSLMPNTQAGLSFDIAIAGVVLLIVIRHSLPGK